MLLRFKSAQLEQTASAWKKYLTPLCDMEIARLRFLVHARVEDVRGE